MAIIFQFLFTCICFGSTTNGDIEKRYSRKLQSYGTIYVDPSIQTNFSNIQAAIDSVPSHNKKWISISVKAGIYNEQVIIPQEKPFIYLKGEGIGKTSVVWGAHDSMSTSATFASYADNTVVSGITFVKCSIQVNVGIIRPKSTGYITAHARTQPNEPNGFVFKECNVSGIGKTYLGRAWRAYSRVIYYHSFLSDIVVPLGWHAWNYVGQEDNIVFSEDGCQGPGSDKSNRVKWEKDVSPELPLSFTSYSYIDTEGWIGNLPLKLSGE
ncbi:hypothetical protein ACJIZ3_013623 [Penstemon smallii]|uniref:pectinesterase n=1 Tax=Penstemon smallii TaxID=265156 RepID=A0ABD3RU75_9LAMI